MGPLSSILPRLPVERRVRLARLCELIYPAGAFQIGIDVDLDLGDYRADLGEDRQQDQEE